MTETAPIDPAFAALLQSDRVSRTTRDALLARALPVVAGNAPDALAADERTVLRALVARIVPQREPDAIDLAARIEASLAQGDGWRFAALPPDRDAYRAGLRALRSIGFAALDEAAQDATLARLASGDLHDIDGLDGDRLRLWFEDVRADATKAYVAHPATLARIGYSGVGYGGDGERLQGFSALEPGERETWEPRGPGRAP